MYNVYYDIKTIIKEEILMNYKKILAAFASGAMIASMSLGISAHEAGKIDTMIENMTTEEKITQMIMPAFRTWQNEDGNQTNVTELNGELEALLERHGFAGVILFGQNTPYTESNVRLIDEIRKTSMADEGRPDLFIAVDQEGGTVSRLGQGCQFGGNMSLGAVNDTDVTKKTAGIIGSELKAIGYNVDFAPVVDVNNNPKNPVIGVRSFSDDPEMVAAHAVSFIEGLHENGIAAALKHFPGHGNTSTDSHTGLPLISSTYDELKKCEFIPFQASIDAGAEMVMTAHIQYPNIEKETYISKKTGEMINLPATLSKTIITDILRKDMGFDGIVVTDSMVMDAIREHFDALDAAKMAINAGVDILLMPYEINSSETIEEFEEYIDSLVEMTNKGDIDIEMINSAVRRIFKLKEKQGLLDGGYGAADIEAVVKNAKETVGSAEHHAEEFEIAKRSITLLKNDDNTLPIKNNGEKTVILTAYDDELMSMKYGVDLLKSNGYLNSSTEVVIDTYKNMSDDELKDIVNGAKNVIIITELYGSMEPDSKSGVMFSKVDKLIENTHQNGGKAIVISCYLPYDTARFQNADAILAAWSMKGMSEDPRVSENGVKAYGPNMPAAIYLSFDCDEKPTGKLPLNIPKLTDNYEYSQEMLYERGYSISYIDPILGDANGDGKLDVLDAVYIARKLAQHNGDELPEIADFNKDNIVNISDAAAIARYLANAKRH